MDEELLKGRILFSPSPDLLIHLDSSSLASLVCDFVDDDIDDVVLELRHPEIICKDPDIGQFGPFKMPGAECDILRFHPLDVPEFLAGFQPIFGFLSTLEWSAESSFIDPLQKETKVFVRYVSLQLDLAKSGFLEASS